VAAPGGERRFSYCPIHMLVPRDAVVVYAVAILSVLLSVTLVTCVTAAKRITKYVHTLVIDPGTIHSGKISSGETKRKLNADAV